ncbi:MAG: putative signal transducing protein [Parasphingopyxis sp.]|uniref:putative signal transducing protein n=1 Tax=Parasphingopyxis sp. TaxID=1920299 RepID=UPI003FA0144A
MALVELAKFSSGAEAAIVHGRLQADGIESVCFDTGMNIAESVGIMIPVRLMVDEDDLEAARAVIREAEAR